jgi:hypothetical protein
MESIIVHVFAFIAGTATGLLYLAAVVGGAMALAWACSALGSAVSRARGRSQRDRY